jgi:hypothetical protein
MLAHRGKRVEEDIHSIWIVKMWYVMIMRCSLVFSFNKLAGDGLAIIIGAVV